MDQLRTEAEGLKQQVEDALRRIGYEKLRTKKLELDKLASKSDLWEDPEAAQLIVKEQSALEKRLQPWQHLWATINDALELIELHDDSLESDLQAQVDAAKNEFSELKEELKFSGVYDAHNAILSIHAGAGGADAQDWAGMLLRMYLRWAEQNGLSVTVIEESTADEGGIKSATIELSGAFVYGKVKGEHGVHRLVRLSPFNAESRETSFAKVEVMPKVDTPDEVKIDEKDLKIDVYRSGGHGGQSVNTTDSAVRITHLPTGIVVAIQNERSQLQNKETALTIVRSRLAQLQLEQHAERVSELKGPNEQAAWGNQIRSYVLHPYKQVKDLRTGYTSSEPDDVLSGNLNPFISAYLEHTLSVS